MMFTMGKKCSNGSRTGYVFLMFIAISLIASSLSFAQQLPLQQQMQMPAKTISTPTDSAFPKATMVPVGSFFTQNRPKLIVLLHGATDGPTNTETNMIGKLQYARYYWGFKFVCQLMGGGNELFTFSDKILNAANWIEGAYDLPGNRKVPIYAIGDNIPGDHLISRVRDFSHSNITFLLTHRDGSKSLADQADSALNQIFELYNTFYQNKIEPQIILLAHSMGGLVSRYILSDPYRIGTKNSFRANFIRNRTLFLITLATPHEGSPLAAIAQRLGQALLNPLPPYINEVLGPHRVSPLRPIVEYLGLNRPNLEDLRVDRAQANNQTILAPFRAQRADRSLIPIYVLSGRDPSAGRLNNPVMPRVDWGTNERDQIETAQLVLVDQVFKSLEPRGWGTPPVGYGNLDKIQRVSFNQLVETNVREIRDRMDPATRKIVDKLGGIIAISNLKPFDATAPVYLNQKWTVGTVNVNVPFKHWECGTFRAPWDDIKEINLEALVRFFQNLGYDLGKMVYCLDPFHFKERWSSKETISVQTIGLTPMGTQPPTDGEADNDGLVGIDSGLGLNLGQPETLFFDHTRQWQVGWKPDRTPLMAFGSWYRYFDGPWNSCNHGTIFRNANVGQWLFNNIINPAGPVPGPSWVSEYPGRPRPAPPAAPR